MLNKPFRWEDEVPPIELCKALAEHGYPQTGSGLYWVYTPHGWKVEYYDVMSSSMRRRLLTQTQGKIYRAPTLRELGELLFGFVSGFGGSIAKPRAYCFPLSPRKLKEEGATEPEVRARMLLTLMKRRLVKFHRPTEIQETSEGKTE